MGDPAERSSLISGVGLTHARPAETGDATTLRGTSLDLTQASSELDLVVLQGADTGARYALSAAHPSPYLVGQSATCEVRLKDRSISRRHAAIDASSWPVRVRDLGSTNGTLVNGVAIEEARLVGGETLRLGDTILTTERRVAGPRTNRPERERFGRTLGASAAMVRLYSLCDRLAASTEPVLIEGEPGTGKELLAESLHESGPRASAPFVVIDCTLGGRDLARRQRESSDAFEALVAQAGNGTLLLDEVGALDAPLQRALARVLAGSVDARLVVASRTDLDALVQRGRFREDLYARISVARVELPPLRARHGDVEHLARHFWADVGGEEAAFPADTVARAEAGSWPGNVRELRELVSRLSVRGGDTGLAPRAAPEGLGDDATRLTAVVEAVLRADVSYAEARSRLLVEFEQRYVTRMLIAHHGNVTRAAAASGLARRNFQLIRARCRDET